MLNTHVLSVVAFLCFSENEIPSVVVLCFSENEIPSLVVLCFSQNEIPRVVAFHVSVRIKVLVLLRSLFQSE